jgi:flagellar motor switch protein FliN/FliY
MTMMSRGLDILRNVDVRVSVELGRTQMKLKDVLALGQDSVVALERLTDELLVIQVNGQTIARGEIVTIGDRFALRIVEMGCEPDADQTLGDAADKASEAARR